VSTDQFLSVPTVGDGVADDIQAIADVLNAIKRDLLSYWLISA
jgi:hypothetical protein